MLAEQQNPGTKPALKNPILYSSLALLAVLLYVMWIFFARWQENRNIQRRASEEKTQKQLADDRQTVEQMGGKELAIQSFYASAGQVHRGESLQLCYGVANAKTVKLEPQDNPVWPSYNRCVEVSPHQRHHLYPDHSRCRREHQNPDPGYQGQVAEKGHRSRMSSRFWSQTPLWPQFHPIYNHPCAGSVILRTPRCF